MVAADGYQVRTRAVDRDGSIGAGQPELAAGQGDPLRGVEQVREDDRVAPVVQIRLDDRRT